MQKWIIPSNPTIYDANASFEKNGFIDWRQNKNKYKVGDIVYLYISRTHKKIMFKAVIEKVDIPPSEATFDKEFWLDLDEYDKSQARKYCRIRFLEKTDREELSYECLKGIGLKGSIQSPRRIDENMVNYIEKYFKLESSIYPDSDIPENYYEGAVTTTTVNKYERNPTARKKCIEYHGCECSVCSLSFEKMYGELGKDFIHVHHIVPLNTIGKEYEVDYKTDLIPVCPNCHAMLHRKLDGEYYSVEELKSIVKRKY